MRGKKARYLRRLSEYLTVGLPQEATRAVYKLLKKGRM